MGEPIRCTEAALENGGQDVLQIFSAERPPPPGGPHGLSADMTLGEFADAYYKPVHLINRDARNRNVAEIDKSVDYWARFTGDPPLSQISVYHCADFIQGLKTLGGRKYKTLGNNTIRKHAACIQAIIDLCGQPDRWHRDRVGLLRELPYINRPRQHQKEAEDCFTLAEIERLIDGADAARLPAELPCSAATYLRRLYAFVYNTGVRITGAMEARWSNFHRDHLILPARVAVKGLRDFRIELNDDARAIVESMQGCGPSQRTRRNSSYDADRIFAWPWEWPASRSSLYKQHRLVVACLPPNRRFAFHAERRATNNELARINPKACEKVLGHTLGRTNVEAYTSRQIAAEAVAQLPRLNFAPNPQQRLFD